jgi:ankyrin repeat protein
LLPRSDPLAVDKRGTSALMEAVLCGELDCVHVLLPLSDPMAVRDNGRSALMSRPSWAMRTA